MRTARLGEVCQIVSGATPKTNVPAYWEGDIPWATPKDLSDLHAKHIGTTARSLTMKGLRSCSAVVLPRNSVLLSSRAPIGLVAINTVPMATNQGFKSLVPDPDAVNSDYLYWWLRASIRRLQALGRGATFTEVSKAIVADIEIPLPPIEEQRRIAAVLDKAEDVLGKRKTSLARIDSLNESIFLDMFGDPVANPRRWAVGQTLGEVANVVSGITKGRKPTAETRQVPYLAVANVQAGGLRLDSIKLIEATENEIAKYRLRSGDIVLTEGGDRDKLGRGTVWRGELQECLHQNHVFRVRVHDKALEPRYLSALLASQRGRRYFLRAAKQTTGIASINKTQLCGFPMLCPPIELQREYVARLDKAEAVRAEMLDHAEELSGLFSAVQHRAFAGQL